MSAPHLSRGARALLDAAKSDGPRAASRASIWGAVSAAAGAAATATAATSGSTFAAAASVSSGKLLTLGALLGSGLTLGMTLAILRVAPAMMVPHRALPPEAVDTTGLYADERFQDDVPPIPLIMGVSRSSTEDVTRPRASRLGTIGAVRVSSEDPLMREAAFVADARAALVRSDAEAALSSLDAARRVGSRGLEPEELSLRARALRTLGREEEAAELEWQLRTHYPDHFLSR